jgi:DNA-binding NtrC family response regulator
MNKEDNNEIILPKGAVTVESPVQNSQNNFMTLAEVERKHIEKALVVFKGNKTHAAKALGISLKTLYNKLHTYGMMTIEEKAKE